nr:4Fe-4S binding protein [uncultured Desulfuromonas sp.]
MAYLINEEECISCGACEPVCPVSCISVTEEDKRRIDGERCIDCGACADVCPVACIDSE